MEVNGVAPNPRAILPADQLPEATRVGFPSVEFGAASPIGKATVDYHAFRSEPVVHPVAGTLALTRLRLADPDSGDRVQLRGDYALGNDSDGIDPSSEPATIMLSTPSGGQFYPPTGVNPLNGFDVRGSTPRRRWTLNKSERARTAIERLLLDEGPGKTGGLSLRDVTTGLPSGVDFSTVDVELTIGTGATADRLTGTAHLVEKPAGSGRWRLASEK